MKSKSEKSLFGSENQFFFIKNISDFCNLTGKVLKTYSYYLSVFKFDAAFSTYIHLVVYTYKPAKISSFFASKFDILISRYISGNACIAITCMYG